ncbi:hypothetical protein AB0I28_27840 [Phytomonospora sp. NPDC050363]|uniref:hypothetical protein n=1 Tax=Phytomonospora sp. NPDC050363 TaxID=3155642 RepID=UPI0033D7FD52
MTEHERVRDELRALPETPVPEPPADLADTVLDRLGRRRRAMGAGIAVLVLVLLVALPLAWVDQPRQGAPPAGQGSDLDVPGLSAPGGGPMMIQVYTVAGNSFVFDPRTGAYRGFALRIVYSADLVWSAAMKDGKVGVATREALLRDGESALSWLDVPPADGAVWAPDGSALLVTEIDRSLAHRHDPATGTTTAIPLDHYELAAPLAWAGDSENYAVTLAKAGRPSGTQYVDGDGKAFAQIEGGPGHVAGYSPNGLYGYCDGFMKTSTVFYAQTGTMEWSLPTRDGFAGWYDDEVVALVDASTLELVLVNVIVNKVIERVALPVLPESVQIGPTPDPGLAFGF